MSAPKFKDLKRFCEKEGYELKSKDGKHFKYIKNTEDGYFRTDVSKAPNKDIPPHVFRDILKNQICVKEDYFWKIVKKKK